MDAKQAATLYICHHCDNPPCVNPAHLYEGTPLDNQRDAWSRHRAGAQQATHCLNGHEWTAENTVLGMFKDRPWIRRCRACLKNEAARQVQRQRERRQEKRSA